MKLKKQGPLAVINKRRKDLGISLSLLAKKAKVSEAFLVAQLQQKDPPDLPFLRGLSEFLGLSEPTETVAKRRRRQALTKASYVAKVAIVTKGVPKEHYDEMVELGTKTYLEGPNDKLWA